MEITPAQFATIEHCLPKQRGNVSLSNLQVVNAILYVAEHGCKWRGLPKRFGNWHTIYTRMNRWTKAGVLDRMFEELQRAQVVRIKIEAVSLDSTSIKVHPDGTGAPKKNGPQAIGKSRGGWNTKIHMVAADARTAVTFCLSPGQAHDAPEGRRLLSSLGPTSRPVHLLMDRAYEGNETRQLALDLGFIPVVPPMRTRIEPWEYDREMYKRRNEVERLFRRLKGYRRIFSRFEKLDLMFLGFISFVLVADGLRMC
ncbi:MULTISPECIES: IS5 family transposase [Pseudomonadota]|uniref:IS5 family transposase n=1 Tax=Pseudomonadota TaxID=1224 RepID=UPI000FC3FF74|nr:MULTISPECIES: IS5 family transposase [Pseudomonadota]MBA9856292.1 IS5 family transposase [Ralstonia insidiosa]MBA9870354.1 IS5 family transposase [Ralstonia insidiosa]MBA9912803.1 IS5 family transposase [Ralstonia insidiosa]MBA9936260.1 IS5 family transposase [Ralstonia insidiosa]MBA9951883.1 IS5 family transposase [Ralstonia insidiosa]